MMLPSGRNHTASGGHHSAGASASSEADFKASLRQQQAVSFRRPGTAEFSSLTDAAERVKERTRKRCEEHFKKVKSNEDDDLYSTSSSAAKPKNTATRSSIILKQQQLKAAMKSATEDNLLTDMAATVPSTAPHFALFPVAEKPLFPPRRSHAGSRTVGLSDQYRVKQQMEEDEEVEIALPEQEHSTGASLETQVGTIRALGKLRNAIERRPSSIKDLASRSTNAKEINAEYVKRYASKDLDEPSLEVKRKYFGAGAQNRFFTTYHQLSNRGNVLLGGYDELSELILQPEEENAMIWSVQQLESTGALTPRHSNSMGNDTSSFGSQSARARNRSNKVIAPATSDKVQRRAAADATDAAVAVAELYSEGALPQDISNDLEQRIFSVDDEDGWDTDKQHKSASLESIKEYEPHPTLYNVTRLPPLNGTATADRSGEASKKITSSDDKKQQTSKIAIDTNSCATLLRKGGDESAVFDEGGVINYDDNGSSIVRHRGPLRSEDNTASLATSTEAADDDSDSSVDIDKHVADLSLQDSYGIASPRAIFLTGCLQEDIPPMTQALIRRKLSSSINLAHMGIGNKVAAVLATCLPSIPYLQLLNLMDNNLDDDGLSVLIRSVARHQDLEILDISQNIIGSDAAEALAEYIGNPDCRLQCLRMSSANIDDGECANFVDVLMHNQQLKELDMSNNLLGKDENLNTVQPDFVTGGESLAELLKNPDCPLRKLNLHWNMIRLEGAEVLCDSLRTNRVLTHLDLSYNALGSSAACILGSALINNNVLSELNIANNGIEAWGCFTLLVGVRENVSLRKVTLDGNPIGEQGGRLLIKVAAEAGNTMNISASNCDFTIKYSTDKKFNVNDPYGDYNLDLTLPFERAILFEMLHIAASDSAVQFSSFEYAAPGEGSFQKINLHRFAEDVTVLAKQEQKELRELMQWDALSNQSVDILRSMAVQMSKQLLQKRVTESDGDRKARKLTQFTASAFSSGSAISGISVPKIKLQPKSGRVVDAVEDPVDTALNNDFGAMGDGASTTIGKILDFSSMKATLVEYKIRDVAKVAQEVRFALDPLGTGCYEVDEFVEYIANRSRNAKQRIHFLRNKPRLGVKAVDKNGAEYYDCYIPRDAGRARVRLIEGFHPPEMNIHNNKDRFIGTNALSHSTCKQIIRAAEASTNPLCLLFYGIESAQLYFEEGKLLYENALGKTDDAIGALCVILRRMREPVDAMKLVRNFVGTDVMKWRRLKQRLGTTLNPLLGLFSGYYHLDLSFDLDRSCLKKLIELSIATAEHRLSLGRWDTSQNGKWNSFRNEYHPALNSGAAGATSAAPTTQGGSLLDPAVMKQNVWIGPEHFNPLPTKHKLEFDFINTRRPDPMHSRPASDDTIIDLLLIGRLIDDSNIAPALRFLGDASKANRKSALIDGNPHWKADIGRAEAVSEACYSIYSNLHARWKSQQRAQKRELIKSQNSAGPKKTRSMDMTNKRGVLSRTGDNSNVGGPSGKSPGGLKASAASRRAQAVAEANQLVAEKEIATNRRRNMEMVTNSLRSTTFRGKAEQLNAAWSRRLYEVIYESSGTNEYKAAALMEYFELVLPSIWLLCRQLALILLSFKIGCASKSIAGSYRVELAVLFFDRIVDLHNFEIVLMVLSAEEQGALHARIGILNFLNPCKMEGAWQFDLLRWDERQAVKMMVHLSVVEPGENWLYKTFTFDHGFQPIPGWDLSVIWLTEDGLPKKGILCVEIFAGGGMNLMDCKIDYRLRQMFCSLVLVDQRDLVKELELSCEQNISSAVRQHQKQHFIGNQQERSTELCSIDGGDSFVFDQSTVGSLTSGTSLQTQAMTPFAAEQLTDQGIGCSLDGDVSRQPPENAIQLPPIDRAPSSGDQGGLLMQQSGSRPITPKSGALMMQQSYGFGGGFAVGVVAGSDQVPLNHSSSFDGSNRSHQHYSNNAFDGRKRNNTLAPFDAETGVFLDETKVIVSTSAQLASLAILLPQIHLLPMITTERLQRLRSSTFSSLDYADKGKKDYQTYPEVQMPGAELEADEVQRDIPSLKLFAVEDVNNHLRSSTEITWNYTSDNGEAVIERMLRGWRF